MTRSKSITSKESDLFGRWQRRHKNLYKDGIPDPKSYCATEIKTLFVLREPNFGGNPRRYDFRVELPGKPKPFWREKIAPWCCGLMHHTQKIEPIWTAAQTLTSEDTSSCLSCFGYVQLKKVGGAGTSKAREVREYVENDRSLLREQIAIYAPDIIVACGLGAANTFDLLARYVIPPLHQQQIPGSHRRYAIVNDLKPGRRRSYVIETLHPSHRGNRRLRRLVFFELVSSFRFIVRKFRDSF